jgi:alkylhydroperoxidase family enzyme
MLDFAVKLTRAPRSMTREDVEILRAAGFDDTGVHDIVQITGLFAYYNRLADGLGIEPED